MRKQVILIMQGNQYPFGQVEQSAANKTATQVRTLVRKKNDTRSLQQRNQLLEKINIVKTIQSKYLMKIQTVLEEQNSIHVLYEYVPMGFTKAVKNLTQSNIHKIKQEILDLGASLAEVGISVQWDSKNIGISNSMETRYYLDLQRIKLEKKIGGVGIQKLNFQNITNLFSLYLSNKIPKQSIHKTPKQSIKQSVPKLSFTNVEPKKRLQDELDNLFNPKKQGNEENQKSKHEKKGKLSTNRSKRSQQSEKQKKPMRKSRTDWKQLDNNAQFLQDFLNVLDDKSQNAQSKYISDQQPQDPQKGENVLKEQNNLQQLQSPVLLHHYEEQQEEQEQIIWRSTPEKEVGTKDLNKSERKKSEEEEIIWMDYRDFKDIKQRAQAAIRRSTHILSVFRSIINNK